MYQDDIENSSITGDKNNAKKHCLRTYNQQTKENPTSSQSYSQQARKSQKGTNQSQKHFQSYPDENKPPPAKIANTKNSPPHSTRESTSTLSTSARPSFVIHQDNNPNLDHILSRTSAAEFRNSCNDTIRSTSSPATDILERDNDVFSLLHQHNQILEDENQMDDETTIQGGEENEEVIAGTSEADELDAVIEIPSQPVSEAVLISEEYSADILAHVKRTEVK